MTSVQGGSTLPWLDWCRYPLHAAYRKVALEHHPDKAAAGITDEAEKAKIDEYFVQVCNWLAPAHKPSPSHSGIAHRTSTRQRDAELMWNYCRSKRRTTTCRTQQSGASSTRLMSLMTHCQSRARPPTSSGCTPSLPHALRLLPQSPHLTTRPCICSQPMQWRCHAQVFGPAFRRQARWSVQQPVPELGEDEDEDRCAVKQQQC